MAWMAWLACTLTLVFMVFSRTCLSAFLKPALCTPAISLLSRLEALTASCPERTV